MVKGKEKQQVEEKKKVTSKKREAKKKKEEEEEEEKEEEDFGSRKEDGSYNFSEKCSVDVGFINSALKSAGLDLPDRTLVDETDPSSLDFGTPRPARECQPPSFDELMNKCLDSTA
eukprot:TRINITY_DN9684_c0_g1_i3.p2 TRINITY_DN9684_c0_g1~~TRINITY_DN9684_c0_g1_i3.p2  ORF type:complete len:116 (+),score=43.86 TRINITY_DN9684_c0_g1_i3:267-614(+)